MAASIPLGESTPTRLLAHTLHPSTFEVPLPSTGPSRSNAEAQLSDWRRSNRTAGSASLSASAAKHIERLAVFRHARGDHLPSRGIQAEKFRMRRALDGLPPVGTTADADDLSDEEAELQHLHDRVANFGDDYIVQIGRMRTRQEEDLSATDRGRTPSSDGSDAEGGPSGGPPVGHTGHAAAAAAAAARQAQITQANTQARTAADAGRLAAMRARARAGMEMERDLDASVEDMD
ncbi:hypothetical protein CBOM_04792 [Ceraceosorus bombacis]|uniref:Uncharacterized protein n=1 Tax=Ceraceosorus bombacis TaxID=401625 RepID=A0A0P1BQQ2_9BASI|nr:hypothetical protein CBOM_04792 [Ceraceosorus bombacis]